jgi:hypothetical protein
VGRSAPSAAGFAGRYGGWRQGSGNDVLPVAREPDRTFPRALSSRSAELHDAVQIAVTVVVVVHVFAHEIIGVAVVWQSFVSASVAVSMTCLMIFAGMTVLGFRVQVE